MFSLGKLAKSVVAGLCVFLDFFFKCFNLTLMKLTTVLADVSLFITIQE